MTERGSGTSAETRAFMRQFQGLLERMAIELPTEEHGEQPQPRLTEHLGVEADALAVVTESVPSHRLVDGDIALQELAGPYAGRLFGEGAMAAAAARSGGTTASFAKEVVRRAVLRAALEGANPPIRIWGLRSTSCSRTRRHSRGACSAWAVMTSPGPTTSQTVRGQAIAVTLAPAGCRSAGSPADHGTASDSEALP